MDEAQREALIALPEMRANIEAGRLIYCSAPDADPGADCWAWLRGFIGLIYALIKAQHLRDLHILFTYADQEPRR